MLVTRCGKHSCDAASVAAKRDGCHGGSLSLFSRHLLYGCAGSARLLAHDAELPLLFWPCDNDHASLVSLMVCMVCSGYRGYRGYNGSNLPQLSAAV
jgi:hypothetical protein